MAKDVKKRIKNIVPRSYLSKDFNGFKQELIQYAKTYFPDKIKDFSDPSVGGMFLDFAAFVGDSLSFYLDHQFNELNLETAVETINIESLLRNAGVKVIGATPSIVSVDIYLEVESEFVNNNYVPRSSYLPIIKAGTQFTSTSGVRFELIDSVDFQLKIRGDLVADFVIDKIDTDGNPSSFIVKATGKCVSGITHTESFALSNVAVPFRKISLTNQDVTQIISVKDSDGNSYHEVESLTQDVVYKRVSNTAADLDEVSENIEVIPAPYRFTASMSKKTGVTTLTFGSGQADSLDDDIIPDPSELALPLYGKKTFSRFSIDPGKLLETQSLGISPKNTTLSITYRAGGGLSHNVDSETIKGITNLSISFTEGAVPTATASAIRGSLSVLNQFSAEGGEDPPTLSELRGIGLSFKNSQSRIVTRQDLMSRIYTMPSSFGRVYRVGISSNPNNPLATRLHILSRNRHGQLAISPDTLKRNIRTYINQFRLISDAIDVLDGKVVNIGVEYTVVVDSFSNTTVVVQQINAALKEYFKIQNFQIGEPIFKTQVENIVINTDGVLSLTGLNFTNNFGLIDGRQYSTSVFPIRQYTKDNILIAPEGTIFEVRFPDSDIVGNAT
jgi:hypothetical protein